MRYILAEVKREATVGLICLVIYLCAVTYRTRLFQEMDTGRALGLITSAITLLILGTCVERIRSRAKLAREKDRKKK